jgi:hypothetical protein
MGRNFFCLTLAVFLAVFFPVMIAAQALPSWAQAGDRVEESDGEGLAIWTKPTGASVFIDGLERGKTPLSLENLRPGRYFVRIAKEG